jgi:release factor glutamine methyltransferase
MAKVGAVYDKALAEGKPFEVLSADVRLLICHDEGYLEQIDVIMNRDKEMLHEADFWSQFDLLKKGEPVEYILHEASFLRHRLYVDERVLIPREETEELVADITERISDYYDPRNFLVCADIGTGSGAIALALKEAFPNWVLLASDISEGALAVAKKNFADAGLRIETLEGDALQPYIANRTALDILVSNPPYILNKEDAQASVRDYEPASALWLDKEKSVYESIFRDYEKVKKGSLFMAFEISPDLQGWLMELMKRYLKDYDYEFAEDLSGLTRFLFVNCK